MEATTVSQNALSPFTDIQATGNKVAVLRPLAQEETENGIVKPSTILAG